MVKNVSYKDIQRQNKERQNSTNSLENVMFNKIASTIGRKNKINLHS